MFLVMTMLDSGLILPLVNNMDNGEGFGLIGERIKFNSHDQAIDYLKKEWKNFSKPLYVFDEIEYSNVIDPIKTEIEDCLNSIYNYNGEGGI